MSRVRTCLVTAPLGIVLSFVTSPGAVLANPSAGAAAGKAAGSWLASQQLPNGAFFAEDASALGSGGAADAVVSLVAADGPQDAIGKGLSYVVTKSRSEATGPGQVSRLVMALAAGGKDPRDVGSIDYVDKLRSFLKPSGAFDETNVYANSLALIGMVSARESIPASVIDYIRRNQCAGGGFSWQPGCLRPADIDTTALTIDALIASGVPLDDAAVSRGRFFLLASQTPSGGFGYEAGKAVNANSTALALTTIAAMDESPRESQWDRGEGKDPLSALLAMREASGAFRYEPSRDDNSRDYATIQGILGAMGSSYPVVANAVAGPGQAAGMASASDPGKPSIFDSMDPQGEPLAAIVPITATTITVLAEPQKASTGDPEIRPSSRRATRPLETAAVLLFALVVAGMWTLLRSRYAR